MAETGGGPSPEGPAAEAAGAGARSSPAPSPEHAAQLEGIMRALPEGVVVVDTCARIVRLNPAAEQAWRRAGFDALEAGTAPGGSPFFELRADDGRVLARDELPLSRALRGETVQATHLLLTHRGGGRLWLSLSAAPIRDPRGAITGAVLTFADETASHEAAEAREDLVRMVCHDLRTPLSAIYGQAHLIRRGGDGPAQTEARAGAIERACERMSGMLQDLAEVSLLESGQLPIARARVDATALVSEILFSLRGGLEVDRVRLHLPALCWAELDPARLERIIVNLVSNALKYSSAAVDLSLASEAGAVILEVRDAGPGISPEDQARIFERYFRVLGTRHPEGLGLGLYITRLLAEAQGGRVEVESQLGQGSTFRVVFPGAAAEAPAERAADSTAKAG